MCTHSILHTHIQRLGHGRTPAETWMKTKWSDTQHTDTSGWYCTVVWGWLMVCRRKTLRWSLPKKNPILWIKTILEFLQQAFILWHSLTFLANLNSSFVLSFFFAVSPDLLSFLFSSVSTSVSCQLSCHFTGWRNVQDDWQTPKGHYRNCKHTTIKHLLEQRTRGGLELKDESNFGK